MVVRAAILGSRRAWTMLDGRGWRWKTNFVLTPCSSFALAAGGRRGDKTVAAMSKRIAAGAEP